MVQNLVIDAGWMPPCDGGQTLVGPPPEVTRGTGLRKGPLDAQPDHGAAAALRAERRGQIRVERVPGSQVVVVVEVDGAQPAAGRTQVHGDVRRVLVEHLDVAGRLRFLEGPTDIADERLLRPALARDKEDVVAQQRGELRQQAPAEAGLGSGLR